MDDSIEKNPDGAGYEALVDLHVARHVVGFAHDTHEGAMAGGSGVLIQYGHLNGVLTCAHVLSDILDHARRTPERKIGLVANGPSDSTLQAIKIGLEEFSRLPMVIVRGKTDTEMQRSLGPDLGFVALPSKTMADLGSIGSPLNLDMQAKIDRALAPAEAREVIYVAAGNVAERITTRDHDAEALVTTFETMFVAGTVHREAPHGYDRFRLVPAGMLAYPSSYEGLSGGGVWIVAFGQDTAGALEVVDRRLAGIAYYQTAADETGHRHLLFHGPSSVYDQLLPEIAKLAPP